MLSPCIIPECKSRKNGGKGMCEKHYKRWKHHGHAGLTTGAKCQDVAERFAHRGQRTSAGCLEWTGTLTNGGYGKTKVNDKSLVVHRLAWERTHGPIPPGMCVC